MMAATVELNPYEREIQYGYPYVIGRWDKQPVRGPLFTLPVSIRSSGRDFVVAADDDVVRFNSLPYRTQFDSAANDLALAHLIDATPSFPLSQADLSRFMDAFSRELPTVELRAALDGRLGAPPEMPRSGSWLAVVDSAAWFVAPKTSYFIASDLDEIGEGSGEGASITALMSLLGPKGASTEDFAERRKVYFPFSSNPAQRRVAQLADDSNNKVIVVQGPPGTGKSLSIANVVCHLVATGKRVLVTSQRDQALVVVDGLLRQLEMPQLPMTLLRQDRESRRDLQNRLGAIQKARAAAETEKDLAAIQGEFVSSWSQVESHDRELRTELEFEHQLAVATRQLRTASGFFSRLKAKRNVRRAHKAFRNGPTPSSDLGEVATDARIELLTAAIDTLEISAEHRVGVASKDDRNRLREFAKLLGRNQSKAKNFSIFDSMKKDAARCEALLGILPCWIMTPDDVARLFPCKPGLFDVAIVDEASQCDLPSMTPVLYRAKQAIVAGDSQQMQSQRFAFTSERVAQEAWRRYKLHELDPEGWLNPTKTDLLTLASVRPDEEVFLDEHYRSLPPIIEFSNVTWYPNPTNPAEGRLRIMRDVKDRRFGDPDSPIVTLHEVKDGKVSEGTQENLAEAEALVEHLSDLIRHPRYAEASFGVLCLFEEQMRLVSELVSAYLTTTVSPTISS
jgi:hypothetical protein